MKYLITSSIFLHKYGLQLHGLPIFFLHGISNILHNTPSYKSETVSYRYYISIRNCCQYENPTKYL